jgi:hypothetical protein
MVRRRDKEKRSRPPGKYQLRLRKRLSAEHFTKREVLEFGKLWRKYVPPTGGKPRYVPTLQALVDDRRELWARFDRKAREMGWGSQRKAGEWKAAIGRLYKGIPDGHGNPFVTKNVHGNKIPRRLNPWALYDATQKSLPLSDQWDTPRASRGNPVGMTRRFASERRYKEKALRVDIREVEKEIKRTGDPGGRLESQLLSLQYNLKTGSF